MQEHLLNNKGPVWDEAADLGERISLQAQKEVVDVPLFCYQYYLLSIESLGRLTRR